MAKNKLSLKDAFDSQAPATVAGNESLKQNISPAFELIGTDSEKERFCHLINTIAASETGRKTLETASKAGYKLKMEFAFGSNGGTSKSKKLIVLSPFEKPEVLMGVLVHEARHAVQFENGILDSEDLTKPRDFNIKSELMKYRATEADAQATSAQVLWEILEQGDMEPFRAFARVSPEIANRFVRATDSDENAYSNGKARTEAFLGWYDNEQIKTAYEKGYTVEVMKNHAEEGSENQDNYNKTASAKEIIAQTCVGENGKCYFTENPEIISQGKFVDISMSTKNFLVSYFQDYSQKTGKKPDKSFEGLPTRTDSPFSVPTPAKASSALNVINVLTKYNNFQK